MEGDHPACTNAVRKAGDTTGRRQGIRPLEIMNLNQSRTLERGWKDLPAPRGRGRKAVGRSAGVRCRVGSVAGRTIRARARRVHQ